MNKYEAMFIVKPDLSEEGKKLLFGQINDSITKNKGTVTQASIWAEKKKLYFPIKKQMEGTYYFVNLEVEPSAIQEMRRIYKLNDNILRVLITSEELRVNPVIPGKTS